MLKQQGVFVNHKNTNYSSRVNVATTSSGILHGNHQNSGLPINQIVFNQVTDFPIHELVPLTLAILNRNTLLEGHHLCLDVKKKVTKSAAASYVFQRSSTKDA